MTEQSNYNLNSELAKQNNQSDLDFQDGLDAKYQIIVAEYQAFAEKQNWKKLKMI